MNKNDIPRGYEYCELPEGHRHTWDNKLGGIFAIVVAGMLFIAFTDILSLMVRSILAAIISIFGLFMFWKHRNAGQLCPRCSKRYLQVIDGYSENTFFVCENCRIYWDIGRSRGTGGE